MSATRFDTTSWLSGAVLFGDAGFGVIGSLIPSTGDDGPGYIYNSLSLPADNAKEMCGRITSFPSNGTLVAYEDTSFIYTGTTDTATVELFQDGVDLGPLTVTFNTGGGTNTALDPAVGSIAITGYAPTLAQSNNTGLDPAAGTITLTGYAPMLAQTTNNILDPTTGHITITGYNPHIVNQAYDSNVGSVGNIAMFPTGPLWG